MPSQVYKSKRFWCPRSGSINLADSGYLCDPDGEWGKVHNPDLVPSEAISHLPCLALLGEPGIGKTQALEAERSETVNKIQEQGDQVLFLDLRSYGSEDRLVRSLFDSPEFKAWQADTHQLHIFLDSFDECLLRVDTLATLLVDEFKRYQNAVHRLCLRIACRTAVWQPVLEEGLKEIWGENSVGVYELAPLRRADVIKSARAEGISSDGFLKEVGQKNIVPLAIKPVTLGFLLNTYRRHDGQFPSNQRLHELYLEGCKLLCEEINESRRGSNRRGNLDVNQRLIVAARIAAVTILANRFAVWTGINQGNIPTEDVLLQKLCHGYETANGREFEITRVVIEEVLDTGLFSSRGLHRMGWAHQTYAEFLAAWYLVQHEMPLAQMTGLIFSSEDPDRKLIPQLHEAAAWTASMRMDVRQEIIETDPDVLLRSDIPTDSDLREAIVTSLLMQYEQEKLYDYERNQYRNYGKLKHPGLAAQLLPYIQDPTQQIDARDTAIDIAEVCEVFELQDKLVELAFDSSQSIYLRVSAAKALCSIGDVGTRLKLKPLAIEQLPEDEDDRLKGYCLSALWAQHLTGKELFRALTFPKKLNFTGKYQIFFDLEIINELKPHDLAIALEWVEKQGVRCFGHPFDKLGDKIITKAWENFEFLGVAERLAKVALVQWREHQRLLDCDDIVRKFNLSIVQNNENRRELIEQTMSIVLELEEDPYFLFRSLKREVIQEEDFFWFFEKLKTVQNPNAQRNWIQLIQSSFNQENAKAIDAIVNAMQTNQALGQVFKFEFEPVELNSDRAKQMKTYYLESQRYLNRPKPSLLEPPPKGRVLQLLEKLETGDLSAWWQLNMEMALKPDSTHYNNNEFELNLTRFPGWQEADEATRRRIIEGAKTYIQQQDVADDWIRTNTASRPAKAGCRAWLLLLKESSDFLDSLSSQIWKRWAPVIVATPGSNLREDLYLELVRHTYLNATEEFINTLIVLIDKEDQEHGNLDHIFILKSLDKCWDSQLKLALLEKVKDPALKPNCIGELLEKLLKQEFTEAREFTKTLIPFPLPSTENERKKALIAARLLVENSDLPSWTFIWTFVQQDSSFGREVLELVAHRYSHGIQLNLTEAQLADLYIWLVRQYPYDEDPDRSNAVMAYLVTARDGIASLKDSVLSQLKERGTLEACAEVQRLIQELPSITWLTKTLIDTQVNMRRITWQSPQPEQILQLVSSQPDNQNTHIKTEVLIMQGSNNPNLNFGGSVGAVNVNSTVHGNQIGTQHNYASEQNLVEAFDEIQQIFDRLTQNYPTSTESEQQIVVAEAMKEIKQNPTLMKRVKVGGQAFIFEALQKASDQWWVSPFVKAIEAGIKGE